MRTLLICLLLTGAGCGAPDASSSSVHSTTNTSAGGEGMLPGEDSLSDLDFGDDWDAIEQHLNRDQRNTRGTAASSSDLNQLSGTQAERRGPGFGIVLGSFGRAAGGAAAQQYMDRLEVLVPEVASGLGMSTVAEGTLVFYGNYSGWTDPAAKVDLERLRDLTVNDKQVFRTAILTEIKPLRDPNQIREDELLWVRVKYPDIRVLYTLEVALWGDFESGNWPVQERRSAAVKYARSLRSRGIPAFYYHDEGRNMSMVTVGAFDHTAIDAASGLKSAQVERFMLQFPQRMVNGEPLLELYDVNDPSKGGVPQPSRLVEVPKS
ncbi:MAG: hypothetical protein P8L37_00770 [Phycisphaerales bacterium]|nr:hypothetical protein [Phycisphaerales bacterium]